MSAEGSFKHGVKVVTTTATTMMGRSTSAMACVRLKADAGNPGPVWIGNSVAVTPGTNDQTDGYPLAPGEQIELEINDLMKVWVISAAYKDNKAVPKVRWLGV